MSLEDDDNDSSASHRSKINKQLNKQKSDPNEWSQNTEDKHRLLEIAEFFFYFFCFENSFHAPNVTQTSLCEYVTRFSPSQRYANGRRCLGRAPFGLLIITYGHPAWGDQ